MENMIGQRIKERRKELRITQTQIQEQTSVTSGNLSCIENGKYLPSAVALIELSRVLECSTDWILTGESKITKNTLSLDIADMKDKELLNHFHKMSIEDQDELLMIAQIKADKGKRKEAIKLSLSKNDDISSEEQKLLEAYRSASPGIQDATRKLLDLDMPEQETNLSDYDIGKKAM